MQDTYDTLRRHLSNAIYIENCFGLELFKKEVEQSSEPNHTPKLNRVPKQEVTFNEVEFQGRDISVEDFFREAQNFSNKINILPYLFQPEILEEKLNDFILKLSNFPLIIIDWQLEEGDNSKNGLDVFEKIIDNNDVLHYYVIYSNELSTAVDAFKQKYEPEIGQIAQDEIAVINNNAVVLFCDKHSYSINRIIDRLCKFTEESYGFLPQMFLSVKQQIEDRTAVLYNQFMGLDSMMLPQLISDEVYNYEGLQDEVLISVIFNQLRNSVKIENDGKKYLKLVIDQLLERTYEEVDFKRAKDIKSKFSKNLTYEEFTKRLKEIKESQFLETINFDGLKKAAQTFFDGRLLSKDDSKSQAKVQDFILFLSVCSDKDYKHRYAKLLSLIKVTDYSEKQQWTLSECLNREKVKSLCQGDIFIGDNNSFLLCITPSCQLLRPDKIDSTYTFLKGNFAKCEEESNQKQISTMHLVNSDKTKVILVKWQFYSPVVINNFKQKDIDEYKDYKRHYRLNTEYTHKIVELYTEHIKQIGVEELFGKRIKGDYFVEKKKED